MPTISNMLGGTYSLYKNAQQNGTLFNSSKALISNTGATASMFNNFYSSQSSAASAASGIGEVSANVRSLLSSYDKTSKTFYSEFDSAMSNLKDSAAAIKRMDFNVGGASAVTTTENEDGTTTTKKSEALVSALKAVEQLASDYNDAIDFFSDNGEVSKRMGRLESLFADTTYRSGQYDSIGLKVDGSGKFSIDEDKLTKAITEDPDKVSRVLSGLADKAEGHVDVATSQRDRLFPSVNAMFGSQLSTASVYTGSAYARMSGYGNVGNLLNMMF
ncbi:MAG: flagellar filament capping protein FliD [Selenomonadaceae bacterium]|nr:flagellar filament capping protein FliD [Selenomonadaceae bacterium]